jgi:Flp pilus assembly protein TadG
MTPTESERGTNILRRPLSPRKGRRGGAVLELVFFAPWLFFLSVGALDWGFYSYALISMESAARVAAMYTSSSSGTAADSGNACTYALGEMKSLPNIGTTVTSCGASPLVVTATSTTGSDGNPASLVSVTYTSLAMIPIPGLLTGQFTVTRTVKMRIRT